MPWNKNIDALDPTPSLSILNWMQKPKNMGDTLRKVCNSLSVQILEQVIESPLEQEREMLTVTGRCYTRKIFLAGDQIPFCYCKVTLDENIFTKYANDFKTLGTKLIGETMLYNNPKTIRGPFEYGKINADDELYFAIMKYLPLQGDIPENFWGRRSLFLMNGEDELLITEIFLPSLPHFPG